MKRIAMAILLVAAIATGSIFTGTSAARLPDGGQAPRSQSLASVSFGIRHEVLRGSAALPRARRGGQAPSTHSVTLNWKASADAGAAYNVYRSMTSGSYSSAPLNGSTPLKVTTYTDTNVTVGNKYFYVVRSVLNKTESPNSNEVSAMILPAPPSELAADAQ